MSYKYGLIIWFIFFCLHSTSAASPVFKGKSEGMAYEVHPVAEGYSVVWGMSFISEGELIVTERNGTISLLDVATGEKTAVSGGPEVWARGQGGLLDVALYEGADEQWLYFTYSKEINGKAVTTLARSQLEGNKLVNWEDLLVTQSVSGSGRHFGSRITFDDDGYLYFSIGDRGERPNGQDTMTHAGTIVRLNLDGSVPKDNPFVNGGGLPEIWTYGHRNPQGMYFDRQRNILWSNEHGPRGGDEINIILKGENYGWATVSHGKEYWGPLAVGEAKSKPGMADPVKVYIPSIAPGSLIVYEGDAFPSWKGHLFAGALAMVHLNRVEVDGSGKVGKEEQMLEALDERIRALIESKEGYIYFSTDSGSIFRITPAM